MNHMNTMSWRKVILALVLAALIPSLLLQNVWMLMYVPSESMAPTLTAGDILLGTRLCDDYQRGDIVAFQADAMMMKRVIGLEGEEIHIAEDGRVFVNKTALDEPYVICQRRGQAQTFVVPKGCVLLLGDNRQHSYDARYWENPYICTDDILAIAQYKLFGGRLGG